MRAIRGKTRLGSLTKHVYDFTRRERDGQQRRPFVENTAHKERFWTFPLVVHEPPDRSSQLNNLSRAFRNPGATGTLRGRPKVRMAESRNSCCKSSNCFSREVPGERGTQLYMAHREAWTCRSTVKDEAWRQSAKYTSQLIAPFSK